MMMHVKPDSDVTSLDLSSPSQSPKRPVYFVQSPSRDSHDGNKSSSMQVTPIYNSPMESPSHPSYGHHSRASSASQFSGTFRSSLGEKGNQKRNDKGWPEGNAIEEEGSSSDLKREGLSWCYQILLALLGFVLLFAVFSLIIWGASQPYKADIVVRSLTVNNFYYGEGSDYTGVPTKMVTMNCSLRISVYNPASLFGIHVSSSPINILYSDVAIATGQLKKYYQPRKSRRVVSIILEGTRVPLYGAGTSFTLSVNGSSVPFRLDFGIKSRGDVVGKLVRTTHSRHISCPLVAESNKNKPIKFKEESCTYD